MHHHRWHQANAKNPSRFLQERRKIPKLAQNPSSQGSTAALAVLLLPDEFARKSAFRKSDNIFLRARQINFWAPPTSERAGNPLKEMQSELKEKKYCSIRITQIEVWSDHLSAQGGLFHIAEWATFKNFKRCDIGLFLESVQFQKLVLPSSICSGCHNGFVRLWILYLSAGKVCIFGSKFLPSWCGSVTSESLLPPLSAISTEEEVEAQWSNVKWLLGAP